MKQEVKEVEEALGSYGLMCGGRSEAVECSKTGGKIIRSYYWFTLVKDLVLFEGPGYHNDSNIFNNCIFIF